MSAADPPPQEHPADVADPASPPPQEHPAAPPINLPHDMLVAVLQKVVPSAYGTMIRAAMVCRAWRDASLDPALEMTWRQVCLRHSPVALATSESAIDYAYVCTPFNNPTIHSPLTQRGRNHFPATLHPPDERSASC
uniref:F-box domain-containing protein n=1 Tax=Emiliania huxleyi TaxID=2903 RepID=A0A7S3TQR1_EMIHU